MRFLNLHWAERPENDDCQKPAPRSLASFAQKTAATWLIVRKGDQSL